MNFNALPSMLILLILTALLPAQAKADPDYDLEVILNFMGGTTPHEVNQIAESFGLNAYFARRNLKYSQRASPNFARIDILDPSELLDPNSKSSKQLNALHLTPNSRIVILGHGEPGKSSLASDDHNKEYQSERIAQFIAFNLNGAEKLATPPIRPLHVSILACSAGLHLNLFGNDSSTIYEDTSFSARIFLELRSRGIYSTVSGRTGVVIYDPKNGTFRVLPPYSPPYNCYLPEGTIENYETKVTHLLDEQGKHIEVFGGKEKRNDSRSSAEKNNEVVRFNKYYQSNEFKLKQMDSFGYTTLHRAAMNGDIELALDLLKKGANVNVTGPQGTPLDSLITSYESTRSLDMAKILLDSGAEIKNREGMGLTSLHLAARSGSLKLTQFFLERGMDINARDTQGKTPLQLATSNVYTGVVRFLIEKGADKSNKDIFGMTAYDEVLKNTGYYGEERTEMLKLLKVDSHPDSIDTSRYIKYTVNL